jgi:hypothetical protein
MLTDATPKTRLTLADHLAAADWWDDHVLGYQTVTALERQEHVISRLKIVAALTKELSTEQKSRLLERAQHWPESMAKQVARAARAAERFRGRSHGFFAKMNRKWSTI